MKRKSRRWVEGAGLAALIIFAGGLSLISLNQTLQDQRIVSDQANVEVTVDAKRAHDQIERECARLPVPEQTNCKEPIITRAREAQRREYEIQAARNAAVWNEAMGRTAILSIVFSVSSLILIYLAFTGQRDDARRSKKAAKKATETSDAALAIARDNAAAAVKQVEISQDTAYRQLRAYLSIESLTVVIVTEKSIKGSLTIRNAGQTPATIKVSLTGWIASHPQAKLDGVGPNPYEYPLHKPFINRGSDETLHWYYPLGPMQNRDEGAALIQKLIADPEGMSLYVYGRVEFVDFQRRERILNFAFRSGVSVEIGKPAEMRPVPFGNHYEERDKVA
jgi:hypothetical protein